MILGAGIYSVVGKAAGIAGHALWLSVAVGAVPALLTGLSYAELATAFPKAGAEYVYLREAAPRWRWPSTLVGVVIVLAGAGTAAAVAIAFAGYLTLFVAAPEPVVAVLLLILMTAVNVLGIETSARINGLFTLIEVAGLCLVIALGITRPDFGRAALQGLGPAILPAAALLFFAFLGFEEIANLAEEARDPARDVPHAILIGVVVSAVLYALVALSATTLLSPSQLAASASPLADAVGSVSPAMSGILGGAALFATANTGLIALVVTSRMLFGMARGGDLPPVLASTLRGRRTPWVAALATLGVALAVVPLGAVELIAGLASFAALIAFLTVNACVVVLRFRLPGLNRPFRVPLAVGQVPILPVAGVASSALLLTQFGRDVYVAGAAGLTVGLVVSSLRGLWSGHRMGRF